MTDLLTSQFVLLAASVLPWLIAGWLRIPYYARYLQLEGYENQRYFQWFGCQEAETRYGKITRGLLLVLLLLSCVGFFYVSLVPGIPIVALVVSGALTSLALYLAPKRIEVNKKIAPIPRRLLITALILETVPTIIAGLVIFALVRGLETPTLWPGMTFVLFPLFIWTSFFLAVMAGPVGYALTPFLLPVANNLLPMNNLVRENS